MFYSEPGLAVVRVHWIKTLVGQVVYGHCQWLPQGLHKEKKREIEQMLMKGNKKPMVQPTGVGTKMRHVFVIMYRF